MMASTMTLKRFRYRTPVVKRDFERNLKVEAIKIVRVEVDEEGRVGVMKELEKWTE